MRYLCVLIKELKFVIKGRQAVQVPNAMTSSLLQSSDAIMSIRHFLSPILRRFRSGNAGGGGEMEAGNENGCDDDNDIFDVLDDKENHQRGGRITMR